MRDHPNLRDSQAREEVTILLKDFGDILRGSMGPGGKYQSFDEMEGDLMEMKGDPPIEPWENEHDRVMDEFNALKFPPESDQMQEQVTESPSMTSQEVNMLADHSADEIWDMARKGEPLAQALINKGLVASLKRMQKQALLEWTREAEDLLASRKTPQARKILTLIKRESLAGNLNSIHDFGRVIFDEFPEYRGDASQLRRLYSEFINQRYLTDPAMPAGEPEDPWWTKDDLPVKSEILPRESRFTKGFPDNIELPEPEPIEEEKVSWWKKLFSSILDAPRGVLEPAIWQDSPEDPKIPMLKPNVKLEIVNRFFDYIYRFGGYQRPELWVKNMFYTGSTATYRYNDTSDVDIHIIVDWRDMIEVNPDRKRADMDKEWQELHDTFWYTLNKEKLPGTKHPIQFYVMKPGEEKKIVEQKEEIYDIGHDVWLIPPGENAVVPEEILEVATQTASEIMNRIDQQVADARKGLIDYVLLLGLVNQDNVTDVYAQLNQKIREIDVNLQEMKEEYRRLKDKRTEAFSDQTIDSNFSLNNVIFKFVERYKYMDTLRKIKRITDDMNLTHDQVGDVAEALKLEEFFEQEIR